MKLLKEYLGTKVAQTKIKATDKTIKQIVKDEFYRLGHDCDLNHIDVGEVTTMHNLFNCEYNILLDYRYEDINPDISQWDVSNVRSMSGMFHKCKVFNCNISEWDVSKVENMCDMFYNCKNFNQDLSRWNVSNVINMEDMFAGCSSFDQDLSRWNVGNVKYIYNMFTECPIRNEYKPKFKK